MIFYIGKTKFKLSFTFVTLVIFMIILCEEKVVLCSLISSLFHECGHIIFMCFSGERPKYIELSLFGMRIDRADKVKLSYKKEILIALGGIAFNLILALFSLVLFLFLELNIFFEVFVINIIIVIINSFPVSVLDFGRAVKYTLLAYNDEEKSQKYMDNISLIFVLIFIISSVVYFMFCGINLSLFAIDLYLIFITIIKKWS